MRSLRDLPLPTTKVMPAETPSKRKRGAADHGMARPSPASRAAAAASAAAAAVAAAHEHHEHVDSFDEAQINQLIAHNKGHHHPITQENGAGPSPAASAEAAAVAAASATAQAALTHYQVPQSFDGSSSQHHDPTDSDGFGMAHGAYALDQLKEAAQIVDADGNKPVVGSDEWHRVRRNNHKEGSLLFPVWAWLTEAVERRRRETINEGISEISKIVPGCEKNKGAILHRAVQFIQQLKENESQNIEKWSLEKLLLDQAITELGSTAERLKRELTLVTRQRDLYRQACDDANVEAPAEAKELEERIKDAQAE